MEMPVSFCGHRCRVLSSRQSPAGGWPHRSVHRSAARLWPNSGQIVPAHPKAPKGFSVPHDLLCHFIRQCIQAVAFRLLLGGIFLLGQLRTVALRFRGSGGGKRSSKFAIAYLSLLFLTRFFGGVCRCSFCDRVLLAGLLRSVGLRSSVSCCSRRISFSSSRTDGRSSLAVPSADLFLDFEEGSDGRDFSARAAVGFLG